MGGSINTHLLILSRVRLLLIRGTGPMGENVASKSLGVEFPLLRGAEETFPMYFVYDGHSAITTTHALVISDLVHLH